MLVSEELMRWLKVIHLTATAITKLHNVTETMLPKQCCTDNVSKTMRHKQTNGDKIKTKTLTERRSSPELTSLPSFVVHSSLSLRNVPVVEEVENLPEVRRNRLLVFGRAAHRLPQRHLSGLRLHLQQPQAGEAQEEKGVQLRSTANCSNYSL